MFSCNQQKNVSMEEFYLYVGAYTQSNEEGISLFRFRTEDGSLQFVSTTTGVENPSYLAVNSEANILIAVNETVEYEGEKSGAVSSFKIDPKSGDLEFINKVSSKGGAPCYISLTSDANFAFVANYVGGNIATFPVDDSQYIQVAADVVQHEGSGPDSTRQAPHAHSIILDPNEKFAVALDLGIDKVNSYLIDKEQGTLTKANEFAAAPGAGPRHLVFHVNGNLAFIINELNSTITSCNYDATSGLLTEIATVNTLPAEFEGENTCADIHISKDGQYLYGSNRGHDSIVVYEIDQQSGMLTYKSHHSVKGKTPRNFMIDPTGQYLLVANQNSNNIVVFKIDQSNGGLIDVGIEVTTPRPVCLKMIAVH